MGEFPHFPVENGGVTYFPFAAVLLTRDTAGGLGL
jgi:hypothetical protein